MEKLEGICSSRASNNYFILYQGDFFGRSTNYYWKRTELAHWPTYVAPKELVTWQT